jgi:hypothetical protein
MHLQQPARYKRTDCGTRGNRRIEEGDRLRPVVQAEPVRQINNNPGEKAGLRIVTLPASWKEFGRAHSTWAWASSSSTCPALGEHHFFDFP